MASKGGWAAACVCALGLVAACGGGESDASHPDMGGDMGSPDTGAACTSDLMCDDGVFCNGVSHCMPGSPGTDAHGCTPPVMCLAGQSCDEVARMCLTACDTSGDADFDGHRAASCGGDDCDDADPNRYPGNMERCDPGGHDEDCDVATLGVDADHDGYVSNGCCNRNDAGTLVCGADCNDATMDVSPMAIEVCDGVDDNCDGAIDEGVTTTFFHDLDGDGFGNDTMTRAGCSAPSGYVLVGGDCDDTVAAVHPGQPEACNTIDDDCDMLADPDCACVDGTMQDCGTSDGSGGFLMVGACHHGVQTCTSGRWGECAGSVAPAPEVCNGADDDCNGTVDDGVLTRYFHDADHDGFGDSAMTTDACAAPADYTLTSGDCDDTRASTHPGATEICNARDDNCDGATDEGLLIPFYLDADHDSYGVSSASVLACSAPAGYVAMNNDCNDANSAIHPGVTDVCDGIDNDCVPPTDPATCTCINGTMQACGHAAIGICHPGTQTCTGGTWGTCSGNVEPATETCDSLDDDCDGMTDEGVLHTYYADCDVDSYGSTTRTTIACTPPTGIPSGCSMGAWTLTGLDCDDTRTTVHGGSPPATEICDSRDNDCNMSTDGAPATSWCNLAPQLATLPHTATANCTSGACAVATCTAPYLDCNTTTAPGCEANGSVDHLHCGTCTRTCSFTCVAGACDDVVEIKGGNEHTCVRRASGTVLCWGRNADGQLGDGTTTERHQPGLQVSGLSDARQLALGGYFTCARRATGGVSCWGANPYGQLGNGTTSGAATTAPVAVTGLTDATDIAAGYGFACARRMTGAVVCWGIGNNGALGNGLFTSSSTPVTVTGLTDAAAVSAGRTFVCSRRTGGGIRCWGSNDTGELGDGATHVSCVSGGSTDCSGTPVNVSTIADATSLELGSSHACAIRTSGAVWCWGNNFAGGIGDGTTTNRTTPVAGPTLTGPSQLALGDLYSCARLASGSVSCWGYNDVGQLGDGTMTERHTPVSVSGLANAAEISTGQNTTCTRRTTGSIQCWGYNSRGEVGDNTTTNRSTPANVIIP